MNSNKVASFILKIRKDNNLTQSEFGEMFNVTCQAVSKWETGKSIPDILILKEICERFNLDINEILDGKKDFQKTNKTIYPLISIIIILFIIIIFLIWRSDNSDLSELHFLSLTTENENFVLSGSVAYAPNRSHIDISRISYINNSNYLTKYYRIEIAFYIAQTSDTQRRMDYHIEENELGITLNDFLENVRFHIDDFSAFCSDFNDSSMFLQILANDSNSQVISYRIDLVSESRCIH